MEKILLFNIHVRTNLFQHYDHTVHNLSNTNKTRGARAESPTENPSIF